VLALPIGPGGDEGGPLVIDLLRTGGLVVCGPPGSGRSTALDAFAAHLEAVGAEVLRLGIPQGDPCDTATDTVWLDPRDEAGVRTWVTALVGRPGVVVADDVGTPAEWAALTALPSGAGRTGVALVAASSPGQLSAHFQGQLADLRRARTGLLLCPGSGDADLLGIRLPRIPLPVRPGSGWLVAGARLERVQVARRAPSLPSPRRGTDQSNSSAGPISCVAYQASS
jgi:S-DNA-T family DNA segregation ATPase FtsK/SpoIIIE